MRFHAILELHGSTATGIEVPPHVIASLGTSQHPKVKVTLRGYTFRTSVGRMGGRYLVPVSAQVRSLGGVAQGDEFDVDIEADTDPRTVDVPTDLAEALDREPGTRQAFDRLSHTAQLRYVAAIEGARTETTRERRIQKTVGELLPGPGAG